MRLFKRILTLTSLISLGLLLTLILIAELAENKVADIALKHINEGVDANIAVENIDLSLITNLPHATLEFSNVKITVPDDTLTQIDRLYMSVEFWPLIKNRFNITQIALEGGWLNYKVDSLGKINFDAFLAVPEEQEEDTTTNELYLSLKQLELNNIFFSYSDDLNGTDACLYIDEGQTSVYIDNNSKKAAFNGVLRANQCKYPKSKLHLMDELKVEIDVTYFNDKLTVADCYVVTDGAKIKAKGEIELGDDIHTDIQVSSAVFDIGELSKYVPDTLLSNYDVRSISGIATLQTNIKGTYNDSVMPKIDAWLQINNGSVAVGSYPTVKQIKLSGMYSNGDLMNAQTTSITIDTLGFEAGSSYGLITASIINLDKIAYNAKADLFIDLNEVHNQLPDSIVDKLGGLIQLRASTNGVLPETFDMHYTDYLLGRTRVDMQLNDVAIQMGSAFNVEHMNGQLAYRNQILKVKDFSGLLPDYSLTVTKANIDAGYDGQLAVMNTLGVNISNFDIATANSQLKGKAGFRNPDNPEYKLEAAANINLDEFMAFVPDTLVKSMTGSVRTSLKTAGQLNMDSIADNLIETIFTRSKLLASFNHVGIEMEGYPIKVSNLNGGIGLQSDSLNLDNISGDFNGITFNADSSFIKNIYSAYWLNRPDTIHAAGYFNFGDIDYAMFEPFMVEDGEGVSEATHVEPEPARYHFAAKGKVTAKSFWYGNALFENLSAFYNVSDSLYIADQIQFDAFKGSTNSSVKVEMLPNDVMKVNFKNSTHGLDINQLLYDFDDFMDYTDEVYISHEQLSGTLNTDSLSGQIIFSGDSLDLEKVKLKANLRLEEGQLKDYPITKEMGEDYNIDGLDNLQFKTLNTKLFVTGGSIYAPLTNIKTNTFDISLFGKQEFDLDCQYHIRFYLKEILRKGKTNRLERKQSKEGKQDDYGGTKGLTSLFAVYKIENGKTVKSGLEGKDSQMRKKMKSLIYVKEAFAELEFHPLIVKYNTGVED